MSLLKGAFTQSCATSSLSLAPFGQEQPYLIDGKWNIMIPKLSTFVISWIFSF